jgi:pyrophosphatase PpaX
MLLGVFEMPGFVFDFDGPIFDGRKAALEAFNATVVHFSGQYNTPDISFSDLPLIRPSSIIAAAFKDQVQTIKELTVIEEHYRQSLIQAEMAIQLSANILETLKILHQHRISVGILSSRRQNDLEEKLRHLGIERLIKCVVGRDSEDGPKSAEALKRIATLFCIEPQHLIVIGDSDADWRCAKDVRATYYHAA